MTNSTAGPFCPLYLEATESALWENASSAHAGLLFDKFADAWWRDQEWKYAFDKGDRSKRERDKADSEKEGHWLKTEFPRRYSASRDQLQELLTEACTRQRALIERLGGKVLCMTNTARFVTGMGREHPLENGFSWHHTLGVPYLPGSSLKGMLRAWLREEHGNIGKDSYGKHIWMETDEVKWQFGTLGRAGRVMLFDMLPIAPPKLDVDVMTPHYGPYYQNKAGDNIPGDWHSPVPISFLTVAADQAWQLGIAPAAGVRSLDEKLFESLVDALVSAIEVAGGGAKTAVGYGRFTLDRETDERLASEAEHRRRAKEEEARRAAEQAAFERSIANDSEPLRKLKQLQRDQNWQTIAGDHNMLTTLQRFAEEHPDPPQDCLDWIRTLLESIPNYQGVWEDPDAMKGKKKDKPKYSSKAIRELVHKLRKP